MGGKKGLGINSDRPALLVTPSPAAIHHYFTQELKYSYNRDYKRNSGATKDKINRIFWYSKILNNPDNPVFPVLKGTVCISFIAVDMWTGSIKNHYFEVRNSQLIVNNGVPINTYQQLFGVKSLEWVFKWHLNLVRVTREYLKGGWLERKSRAREIREAKAARTFLNKFGTTDLTNKAKPELEDKEEE